MKYLPVQTLALFGSWESFGDDVSGIAGYEVSVNDGIDLSLDSNW